MANLPTESNLDASVELITFMWVTSGNDPLSITPEALAVVRILLAQNFAQLPPELQLLFANGRAINEAIQFEWNGAAPLARVVMAQQFQRLLVALGLVPATGNDSAASTTSGETSLGELASVIAWNTAGAGNWDSR